MRTLYQAALQRQARDQDGSKALRAALDLMAYSEALSELEALSSVLSTSGKITERVAA